VSVSDHVPTAMLERVVWTYSNLEVHHLLCKSAHLVVEAEPVFADIVRREDKVALSLLCAVEDDLFCGTGN
jgi:hypothetical protein